jgi:hypothetical protein
MKNRLTRLIVVLLTVGAVAVGVVAIPQFTARPTPELAQPALKKTQPTVDRPAARISLARSAAAAGLDGKLDAVADQVYGQADYTSGTAANPATSSSLNQPSDIAFYWSGQVFVADMENNRVLGWNCGYSYANGEYADFVLGQPDLETTTALDPPTASSMNRPTGVTVGFDGWLYVSDTGNNRVLVFAPTNYDEFFDNEEIYYDPDDYFCQEGWQFPSDFYAPIFVDGQEADYALGQPDFTSGTAAPPMWTPSAVPWGWSRM